MFPGDEGGDEGSSEDSDTADEVKAKADEVKEEVDGEMVLAEANGLGDTADWGEQWLSATKAGLQRAEECGDLERAKELTLHVEEWEAREMRMKEYAKDRDRLQKVVCETESRVKRVTATADQNEATLAAAARAQSAKLAGLRARVDEAVILAGRVMAHSDEGKVMTEVKAQLATMYELRATTYEAEINELRAKLYKAERENMLARARIVMSAVPYSRGVFVPRQVSEMRLTYYSDEEWVIPRAQIAPTAARMTNTGSRVRNISWIG